MTIIRTETGVGFAADNDQITLKRIGDDVVISIQNERGRIVTDLKIGIPVWLTLCALFEMELTQ